MGDNKSIYKRQAYTILSLLGDFGGFVDALVLLLGLFAHFYNAKMFLASISTELPYTEKVSRRKSSKVKSVLEEK